LEIDGLDDQHALGLISLVLMLLFKLIFNNKILLSFKKHFI